MNLEEFRAWERKCLSEAVTNAARLRSRSNSTATDESTRSERQVGDKPEAARGPAQSAAPKREG